MWIDDPFTNTNKSRRSQNYPIIEVDLVEAGGGRVDLVF